MYVGKEIAVNVTGKRLKPVACEKCASSFFYELTRVGVGKASSPFFLAQGWARKRAEKSARRNLDKRLAREAEMVPCPKCHWVNQDLIEMYRRRQYRGGWMLIALLIVAGVIATPVITAELYNSPGFRFDRAIPTQIAIFSLFLLAAVIVWFVRRMLRERINPNATFPSLPNLPPGTPPALMETTDPQTGEKQHTVFPSSLPPQAGPAPWATFRPAQVQFPDVCCVCLQPATTKYSPPLKFNDHSDLAVPLCRRCKMHLHLKWWVTIFMVAIVFAAIGGFLASLPHGIDNIGRWMIFILITLFGSLVGGVLIAGQYSRPYRMKVIDHDRHIVKFAAANPDYTAMLIDQVHESDGYQLTSNQ